jgi:hypothetical protein
MVVNRILAWYRAGINPQDKLPFLATYLGHRDIHSTLVYITVTQDLLHKPVSASGRSAPIACMWRKECSHEEGRSAPRSAARVLL